MGGAMGGLAGAAAAGLGKSHSEEGRRPGTSPAAGDPAAGGEPPVVEAEPLAGAPIEIDPNAAPIGGSRWSRIRSS